MYRPLLLLRLLQIGGIVLVTTSCGIVTLPIRIARNLILGPPEPQTVYVDRRTVQVQAPEPEPSNDARLNGAIAVKTVLRIKCSSNGHIGTGFLDKHGLILTAYHVVDDCPTDNIEMLLSDGHTIHTQHFFYDASYDLAALVPSTSFNGWSVLTLSSTTRMDTGQQITIWGYPEGYENPKPLLTVGYLSGYQSDPTYIENGQSKALSTGLWIINAAINEGHSGSPVLNISDGSVIGIVIRKQIAWSPEIERAVQTTKDKNLKEAVEALRQRSQYNIAYVVPSNAVAAFLSDVEDDQ